MTATTVVARAPLKVSLAGEHAVGYGGSSVVAAAGLGFGLTLRQALAGAAGSFTGGGRRERWTAAAAVAFRGEVDAAFADEGPAAWRRWAEDFFAPWRYLAGGALQREGGPSFHVAAGGDGWCGAGLGSSSAAAAALLAALAWRAGRSPRPAAELTREIRGADRLRHGGIPSGVDGAVIVRGGVLRFRAGRCRPLPPPLGRALLVHSGVARDANRVITDFARRGARVIDRYVARMEEVVDGVAAALCAGDFAGLCAALEAGRRLMASHGLSAPAVDELTALLRRRGAGAAKLTGAGRGGVVVALWPGPSPRSLVAELRRCGLTTRAIRLGVPACTARPVDFRVSHNLYRR